MSISEQEEAFETELCMLIERYINEFDLSPASVIGLLHLRAHDLCVGAYESEDER